MKLPLLSILFILFYLSSSQPVFNTSKFDTWTQPPSFAFKDYIYLSYQSEFIFAALNVVTGKITKILFDCTAATIFDDTLYCLSNNLATSINVTELTPNGTVALNVYRLLHNEDDLFQTPSTILQGKYVLGFSTLGLSVFDISTKTISTYKTIEPAFNVETSLYDGFGFYYTFSTSSIHYIPNTASTSTPFEVELTPYENIVSMRGMNDTTLKILSFNNGNGQVPFVLDLTGNFHFGQVNNLGFSNKFNETHWIGLSAQRTHFDLWVVDHSLQWVKTGEIANPINDTIEVCGFFEYAPHAVMINYTNAGSVYYHLHDLKVLQVQMVQPPIIFEDKSTFSLLDQGYFLNTNGQFHFTKLKVNYVFQHPVEGEWIFILELLNPNSCQIHSIRAHNSSINISTFTSCPQYQFVTEFIDVTLVEGAIQTFSVSCRTGVQTFSTGSSYPLFAFPEQVRGDVAFYADLETESGNVLYYNSTSLVYYQFLLTNGSILKNQALEGSVTALRKISNNLVLVLMQGSGLSEVSIFNISSFDVGYSAKVQIAQSPSNALVIGLNTTGSISFDAIIATEENNLFNIITQDGKVYQNKSENNQQIGSIIPLNGKSFYVVTVDQVDKYVNMNYYDAFIKYELI